LYDCMRCGEIIYSDVFFFKRCRIVKSIRQKLPKNRFAESFLPNRHGFKRIKWAS